MPSCRHAVAALLLSGSGHLVGGVRNGGEDGSDSLQLDAKSLPECAAVAPTSFPGSCPVDAGGVACFSSKATLTPEGSDHALKVRWLCSQDNQDSFTDEYCKSVPVTLSGDFDGETKSFEVPQGVFEGACSFGNNPEMESASMGSSSENQMENSMQSTSQKDASVSLKAESNLDDSFKVESPITIDSLKTDSNLDDSFKVESPISIRSDKTNSDETQENKQQLETFGGFDEYGGFGNFSGYGGYGDTGDSQKTQEDGSLKTESQKTQDDGSSKTKSNKPKDDTSSTTPQGDTSSTTPEGVTSTTTSQKPKGSGATGSARPGLASACLGLALAAASASPSRWL